ncbi:MAG: hypothetical protein IJ792_05050 [Oscillospiraceae bacterium]|nr:hypothetical protein [Oscillospiraceae bacterium]
MSGSSGRSGRSGSRGDSGWFGSSGIDGSAVSFSKISSAGFSASPSRERTMA